MTKTPCKNGCIMCGMCCIVYTINDKDLKKSSYVPCKNLVYDGKHAKCSIHASKGKREPEVCRDYVAEEGYKRVWFDHRFAYYKKTKFMRHMVWCSKNGYLAHLPIMQDLKKRNYKRADDVFTYFIKPYLMCIEGTVASDNEWLNYWSGLKDYIAQAKNQTKRQWLSMIKNMKTNINQKRLQILNENK